MRILALAVVLILSAVPARAQIRASELASVTQMIDGTKITVSYSRPRSRGRDTLFGSPRAVRWDEVWTPGANYATTLEVTRPIKLDGHPLNQGTYSVWMIVRKSGDWTMVLDPNSRIFHMDPPDSNAKQLRYAIKPHTGAFTDVLTWSVPAIRPNGGTLTMQWGTTQVDMNVDVEPSMPVAIAEADAKPYLGTYDYQELGEKGEWTTKKFTVIYEDGAMKGFYTPADSYMKKFALIRIKPDWFAPGLYDKKGDIVEVLRPDETFEFKRVNGNVTTLEVRDDTDKLWGKAKKTP